MRSLERSQALVSLSRSLESLLGGEGTMVRVECLTQARDIRCMLVLPYTGLAFDDLGGSMTPPGEEKRQHATKPGLE